MRNNTVLLHTCCAPCMSYSIEKLRADKHDVVVYFYNPNIHPEAEYFKRRDELVKFCSMNSYELVVDDEEPDGWFELTAGLENSPEGGERCSKCFEMRLNKSALYAKENGFSAFCTALTISPHKNSKVINAIGAKIAQKHHIEFLEENFKKNDGFKKSLELSKDHNLFRQNYCGCVYSIRD